MCNKLLGTDSSEDGKVVHEDWIGWVISSSTQAGKDESVQVIDESLPSKVTTTKSGREIRFPAHYRDGV